MQNPSLYGISQSNRPQDKMWGKNCFNNSFPAALACFMRDHGKKAVYVHVVHNATAKIENAEIGFDDIFNAHSISNEDLYFAFESKFGGYDKYAEDIDKVDLAIKYGDKWLRALQIKLTVVPDHGSSKKDLSKWGPELVIRPADMSTCALGIFDSVYNPNNMKKLGDIFHSVCKDIQQWDDKNIMIAHKEKIICCAEKFVAEFQNYQKPFLLHPIWMTQGQQPILHKENAFDVFVWSDFALLSTCLIEAQKSDKITRSYRSIARFVRVMDELIQAHPCPIKIAPIYRGMGLGVQTDKSFAISGTRIRKYLTSPRLTYPIFSPAILKEIILGDGHKLLSPERRFDQTVYFTAEKFLQ